MSKNDEESGPAQRGGKCCDRRWRSRARRRQVVLSARVRARRIRLEALQGREDRDHRCRRARSTTSCRSTSPSSPRSPASRSAPSRFPSSSTGRSSPSSSPRASRASTRCYVAQATQKRLFGRGKWLSDLRPLIADPTLTAPDLDFADFSKASIEAGTQADGRVDTLPMTFHYNILMFNKELLRRKRASRCPTSFAALVEAAAKLNDPANGVCGFVARGLKNANTPIWTSFLLGYGVDSIDKTGKLNTGRPGSDRRRRDVSEARARRGPVGVAGFNWYECQALYMQGKAAMWIDTSSVGAVTADAAKSKIASSRRLRRDDAGAESASRAVVRERRRHRGGQQEDRAPRGSGCNGRRARRCRRGRSRAATARRRTRIVGRRRQEVDRGQAQRRVARFGAEVDRDRLSGAARHRGRQRVPRRLRHRAHQHAGAGRRARRPSSRKPRRRSSPCSRRPRRHERRALPASARTARGS